MNPEIQEILELQRKGVSAIDQWKLIIRSPRHREAWIAVMENGNKQISRWEKVLELLESLQKENSQKKEKKMSAKSLWILGNILPEAKETLPFLKSAMTDPNDQIRFAMVRLLGKIAPLEGEAIPLLKQMIQDPSPEIRSRVLWTLGEYDSALKNESPLLLRMLEDPEMSVQLEAVRVLEKIGVSSEPLLHTLTKLTKTTQNRPTILQTTANQVLTKLKSQKN